MEEKRTEARAYTRAEGEDAPGDPRQGLAGVGRCQRAVPDATSRAVPPAVSR